MNKTNRMIWSLTFGQKIGENDIGGKEVRKVETCQQYQRTAND